MPRSASGRLVFASVLALIVSAGWAANHYASVITALRDGLGLSPVLLNGAFAIYAVGLVPCLLAGGMLADRVGARPVVLAGGAVAAAGNLLILLWDTTAGLLTGRFIVGLGVGLMISAGTAWAGRLRGTPGVTMAGIALTVGFAVGALASGAIVHGLPTSTSISAAFATSVALSILALAASAVIGDGARGHALRSGGGGPSHSTVPHRRGMGIALATALPMAFWTFACVTTSFLVLAARVSSRFESGALLPGLAAALAFGIYYVFTYLGAGTAVLLSWLLPIAGPTLPLLVIAAIALAAAAVRTGQVRAGVFAAR